jgi:hypothetical protein
MRNQSIGRACTLAMLLAAFGCSGGRGAPLGDPPPVQRAVSQSDDLIVPGERVGPFRLGMYLDEVRQQFGPPPKQHVLTAGNSEQLEYDYGNVLLEFSQGVTPSVKGIFPR